MRKNATGTTAKSSDDSVNQAATKPVRQAKPRATVTGARGSTRAAKPAAPAPLSLAALAGMDTKPVPAAEIDPTVPVPVVTRVKRTTPVKRATPKRVAEKVVPETAPKVAPIKAAKPTKAASSAKTQAPAKRARTAPARKSDENEITASGSSSTETKRTLRGISLGRHLQAPKSEPVASPAVATPAPAVSTPAPTVTVATATPSPAPTKVKVGETSRLRPVNAASAPKPAPRPAPKPGAWAIVRRAASWTLAAMSVLVIAFAAFVAIEYDTIGNGTNTVAQAPAHGSPAANGEALNSAQVETYQPAAYHPYPAPAYRSQYR